MRFAEFKLFESEAVGYVAIGDSHAHAVAQAGGKAWFNLAVPGASSKGTHPKIQEMLGNISKIPKGSVVLISLGANDTANAMAALNSNGKVKPRPPASIASDVVSVIDRVRAQNPSKIIFLLFPNGPGRGPKGSGAEFYGGKYQDEVRAAIKSAVGVPIIDINGKPLTDGVHAGPGTYREVAREVMGMAKPSQTHQPNQSGKPAEPTSDGSQLTVIQVPTTRREPAIADIQKFLIALANSQGLPNPLPRFGVDGIRGKETSMAVMQFQKANGLEVDGDPGPETVGKMNAIIRSNPTVFKDIKKSTDADVKAARGSFEKRKIDTSTIQDPDFNKKLQKIADKLGVSKSDLIAIMRLESGISHTIQNKDTKATGLIQFMPNTARELGTTIDELKNMTAVEQLDYVYKYFVMRGVQPGMKLGDLYLAVFWPAGMGKPDSYIIAKRGNNVYNFNSGLDVTKDGILTAGDVRRAVQAYA